MGTGLRLVFNNTLAQGLGTLLALCFSILGARLLSVPDNGELRTMMVLLPLLMALTLPGFDAIILRRTNLRDMVPMARIFAARAVGGCLGSLLILMGLLVLHERISDTLTFFLLTTALLLPLFETATGYRNYLLGRGLQQRGTHLLLQTRAITLLLFPLFIGLAWLADLSMLWIYPAWMVATILGTLLTFGRVMLRPSRNLWRWRRHKSHLDIAGAVAVTAAGLVYTLSFSLDKLWIRHELGAEALAFYALLIMVPQEVGKILDSSIPLFYKRLFIHRPDKDISPAWLFLLAVPLMGTYVWGFHAFSALIFGPAYTYPLLLVALSSLLIPGLSFEYFSCHRIFVRHASRGLLLYTICGLAGTALAVVAGLQTGGTGGVMLALFLKQMLLPPLFLHLMRNSKNAL